MNRPAVAIAGTRSAPLILLLFAKKWQVHQFFKFSEFTICKKIEPDGDGNVFKERANFRKFFEKKYARRIRSSSDRETSAIVKCSFDDESFSDLFISRPRWSKSLAIRRLLGACLLRSTKMTTLGYFRNWRTNGHERWEGSIYVMKGKLFVT